MSSHADRGGGSIGEASHLKDERMKEMVAAAWEKQVTWKWWRSRWRRMKEAPALGWRIS